MNETPYEIHYGFRTELQRNIFEFCADILCRLITGHSPELVEEA